jgi:hypothetical protein
VKKKKKSPPRKIPSKKKKEGKGGIYDSQKKKKRSVKFEGEDDDMELIDAPRLEVPGPGMKIPGASGLSTKQPAGGGGRFMDLQAMAEKMRMDRDRNVMNPE